MTLIEAILVTLMPTLNIFLSIKITLEAVFQNNLNHYLDKCNHYLWYSQ